MSVSPVIALEAFEKLQAILGDRFSTNATVLEQHGRDEVHLPMAPPDAVVFPN